MPNEETLDHRKEDAIRQAREMQSRAQPSLRQERRPRGNPPARQPRREPPRPPEASSPASEETPPPAPEAPESPLAALFRDKERTVILALLLLLGDEEKNHELVFALMYLLL